jgi:hypothetical protein
VESKDGENISLTNNNTDITVCKGTKKELGKGINAEKGEEDNQKTSFFALILYFSHILLFSLLLLLLLIMENPFIYYATKKDFQKISKNS